MKVYKYFSLLCFFSLILFSNCLINGVFVEAEEMLAKANEIGFDDRNFYGCVVEYYNNELLKEYKLNRVINPSIGSLYVYVVLFILFCSVLGICFYKFKIMSNNSV